MRVISRVMAASGGSFFRRSGWWSRQATATRRWGRRAGRGAASRRTGGSCGHGGGRQHRAQVRQPAPHIPRQRLGRGEDECGQRGDRGRTVRVAGDPLGEVAGGSVVHRARIGQSVHRVEFGGEPGAQRRHRRRLPDRRQRRGRDYRRDRATRGGRADHGADPGGVGDQAVRDLVGRECRVRGSQLREVPGSRPRHEGGQHVPEPGLDDGDWFHGCEVHVSPLPDSPVSTGGREYRPRRVPERLRRLIADRRMSSAVHFLLESGYQGHPVVPTRRREQVTCLSAHDRSTMSRARRGAVRFVWRPSP